MQDAAIVVHFGWRLTRQESGAACRMRYSGSARGFAPSTRARHCARSRAAVDATIVEPCDSVFISALLDGSRADCN